MRNPLINLNLFQQQIEKAKQYIKLQDEGLSKMESAYRVFGTKIGDEMVRLWQHEVILDQPNLN